MNDLGRSATATKSSLVLLAFVLGAGLVLVLLDLLTSNRIQIADEAWLRQQLSAVLTEEQTRLSPSISLMHNSDDKNDNERPDPMYRVSSAAATIGFIMTVSAPDGYNGNIDLLLGVDPHGEITGVRVIQHRETPGLGDDIEISRSDWIRSFDQLSLSALSADEWSVNKDGSHFDAFTGATITPRAVVRAIHRALLWYSHNRTTILNT